MTHPDWALGFADEVWWSRVARPRMASWAREDTPLRLVEQTVARADPDPKALACYGVLVQQWNDVGRRDDEMLLRFVDGRPVSAITTQFLAWCSDRLAAEGKTALLLVWDNASWHIGKVVRAWIGAHNRAVKADRGGYGSCRACCPRRVRGSTRLNRSGGMASSRSSNPHDC